MPCSAYTLSFATICAVVSVSLVAIAFGTDNWQHIQVDRVRIESKLQMSDISPDEFENSEIYRTRTKGLFRICYPETKPLRYGKDDLYLSPIETWCENIDYYIFADDTTNISSFTEDEMTRLHMARSMIALFIVSFFFVFVAFWTGVAGCWRRSPGNVGSTAILMLFACLFSAGGMGLWHGVEFYEDNKISSIAPFKGTWPETLLENCSVWYSWSYITAWVGVGMSFLAFILFVVGSQCMAGEQRREQMKQMQYIMPVYPQKQQYPSYGYGYPGPYHYGTHSQYGQYNY